MKYLLFILFFNNFIFSQKILIPMDNTQKDHLKAYGLVYWVLKNEMKVDWSLNYKNGSFIMNNNNIITKEALLRGITYQTINTNDLNQIYATIDDNNMDIVLLEKAPKIAVYSPKDKQPWDDAVTLALTYAEIDYDIVFDHEVLAGELSKYDWLHLHHEDFTGQYGKFYKSYGTRAWYKKLENDFKKIAFEHGFDSVPILKKTVAHYIKQYIINGGFIFAMCSATDSFDIALASWDVDITESIYDNTGIDLDYKNKLDYSKTVAFENFDLYTSPYIYEFSTIDFPPSHKPTLNGAEADYFSLFEFSAKWDPIPTMLTQNHVSIINGFMGQTTGFNKNYIKKHVLIMGEDLSANQAKYIHGNVGKGTFTFLGGHDPEDYKHMVGDPHTDLSLHKNSPGYRLILNNILFPAAKKKKRKT
tara:strand:+ start:1537 stop:2787 length:1251 start_codon:yes stop_codon:yes gene_type:complete